MLPRMGKHPREVVHGRFELKVSDGLTGSVNEPYIKESVGSQGLFDTSSTVSRVGKTGKDDTKSTTGG